MIEPANYNPAAGASNRGRAAPPPQNQIEDGRHRRHHDAAQHVVPEERDLGLEEEEARDHRRLRHQRGQEGRGAGEPLGLEREQEDAEDGAVEK